MTRALKQSQHGSIIGSGTSSAAPGGSPDPPAALAGPRPFRHLIGLDLAIQAEQQVAIQAEQQVAIQAERLRSYRIGRSYFTQLG
ncbi:MAG TPA: hypothetical protein DEP84_37120 [Chloroflexi bacterium]|nr:hypothetical protein [Chloroflexota bacterium]